MRVRVDFQAQERVPKRLVRFPTSRGSGRVGRGQVANLSEVQRSKSMRNFRITIPVYPRNQ